MQRVFWHVSSIETTGWGDSDYIMVRVTRPWEWGHSELFVFLGSQELLLQAHLNCLVKGCSKPSTVIDAGDTEVDKTHQVSEVTCENQHIVLSLHLGSCKPMLQVLLARGSI